jgi:hypothetical protein
MKLFHISQTAHSDYDTYSDAVVCTWNESEARNMHPGTGQPMTEEDWNNGYGTWCHSPEQVKVEYIGEAASSVQYGVVCASFNAG